MENISFMHHITQNNVKKINIQMFNKQLILQRII